MGRNENRNDRTKADRTMRRNLRSEPTGTRRSTSTCTDQTVPFHSIPTQKTTINHKQKDTLRASSKPTWQWPPSACRDSGSCPDPTILDSWKERTNPRKKDHGGNKANPILPIVTIQDERVRKTMERKGTILRQSASKTRPIRLETPNTATFKPSAPWPKYPDSTQPLVDCCSSPRNHTDSAARHPSSS